MITLSGKWGIDSNLLIYVQNEESPFHASARELFLRFSQGQIELVLTQQNIVECERVLVQKYKRPIDTTITDIGEIIKAFDFDILTPLPTTYMTFQQLLQAGKPRAVDFFDFYLAATLIDNDVSNLLTVNVDDFSKIPGFKAQNPFTT
jgi:predicted nucleic acid-binding protein